MTRRVRSAPIDLKAPDESERECSHKPLTAQHIFDKYQRGRLNLNPDFQRDEAWTTAQKQLLIDSLLRKFDLPKFYFRKRPNDAYDVVDGQQRCRAICEFFNNEFPLARDAKPVNGVSVARKKFDDLTDDVRSDLQMYTLSCMVLTGYDDDLVEELFLRLQNGTPLNPAEKRKAIGGNMRSVVAQIADHNLFAKGLCVFAGKRSAYEDAAAKILHQQINAPAVVDIRNSSIAATYRANETITDEHKAVKKTRQSLDFIYKALKRKEVPLKKYMVLTLVFLIARMLEEYDMKNRYDDIRKALVDFLRQKESNDRQADESLKDAGFTEFTENARNDSKEAMESRVEFLETFILQNITNLVPRDSNRDFSSAQRRAIYALADEKVCRKCGKALAFDNFEADHIRPHARGGPTVVENGQILCMSCNRSKGAL